MGKYPNYIQGGSSTTAAVNAAAALKPPLMPWDKLVGAYVMGREDGIPGSLDNPFGSFTTNPETQYYAYFQGYQHGSASQTGGAFRGLSNLNTGIPDKP